MVKKHWQRVERGRTGFKVRCVTVKRADRPAGDQAPIIRRSFKDGQEEPWLDQPFPIPDKLHTSTRVGEVELALVGLDVSADHPADHHPADHPGDISEPPSCCCPIFSFFGKKRHSNCNSCCDPLRKILAKFF